MGRLNVEAGKFRKDDPHYNIWQQMKQRCYNKNHPHYKKYGGRGITVCKRWLNSFENFINDMGNRPNSNTKRNYYSLERIKNNDNYKPSNCKWATQQEQTLNRRPWIRRWKIKPIN